MRTKKNYLIEMPNKKDLPEISMNWQPIETAPKDATILIGDVGGVHAGYWWETTTGFSGWALCDQAPQEQFNPTHWMPLPEPPA